jgi:uncharacterized protein (DUF885 family)
MMHRRLAGLGLTLAIVTTMSGPARTGAAASDATDRQFAAIYRREWGWREQHVAPDEDDATPVRPFLPDVSPAAEARQLAYLTDVMAQLDSINPAQLSAEQQINYGIYHAQIGALLAAQKFREYEKPLGAEGGFWTDLAAVARRPLKNLSEYRNYLSMLDQLPRYYTDQIANMRAGLARGFTPPRITLAGRDRTIAEVADSQRPEDTAFYAPFRAMPADIPAATQAALRAAALAAISDKVIPAHRELLAFVRDIYIPGARESLAAEALPDGKAYYQSKISEFATVDLSPAQIHQIGLDAVESIKTEMLAVMKEVGFTGDLPAFLDTLRSDKRFIAETPLQLLKEASYIAKQFDGKVSLYFGHLPRARFAIIPVPPELAPFYPAAKGGPWGFMLNTGNLSSRPLYALRALTLHESAPGHAFQIPLAFESLQQPDFRRKVSIAAFSEGWALYCERLGDEMGMYETPYDRFGMLSYQRWRAARLVVDTGLHAMGWSRAQAQDYLRDNTALSDHEIEFEVDRYIARPGQALAYYLGERAIWQARAKAEQALGAKFNIRAFHDTILALSAAPVPVIAARIDRFIAEGGKGPFPAEE